MRTETMDEREFDALLDAIHDDILISDADGRILKVSRTFESMYGVKSQVILGKTVHELESQGVFKPSIVVRVLSSGERVTMTQKNSAGRDIVVTAIPVRDDMGAILKVVSFSRDMTEFLHLKDQYALLENKMAQYERELDELRGEQDVTGTIISSDKRSERIFASILKVARFDSNVLLTGESGTGKNLYARVLHARSRRKDGPFIEINCGAIPPNLLESELFGYEKGSFTGANREGKTGIIELSDKGTLFLDEISEIPTNLQVKILKVIQDKTLTRVGGTKNISVDFRLVTATNRDLKTLIDEGLFRKDLYYRLNVVPIEIAPLRERRDDIKPLTIFFLSRVNRKYETNKTISAGVHARMAVYDWPGNVRELENLVERLVVTSEGSTVTPEDLSPEFNLRPAAQDANCASLQNILAMTESEQIRRAWEMTHSTVGVARLLGVSQPTAARKVRKYIHL
jgi:PAS domain S-box-containing protein